MTSATSANCSSPKPRVASAGVPIRSPDVTIGGRGSNGTAFRLTVMPTSCRRSSACLPSSCDSRRSTSTRCTSVPPVSTLTPAARASSASSRSARSCAPRMVRAWRSLNSSVAAILNAAAFAAMTCMSGPPCCPGNTADWNFLAYSSVPARIMPPRGPASVLWVVDVVRDAAEGGEVEVARVGRPAGDDQLGSGLAGRLADGIHVDPHRHGVDPVGRDLVELAAEVEPHTVREVAAVRELEAEDALAGLEERHHGGGVRLRAAVRLDVRVRGAVEGLDPLAGEVLGDV